MECELMHWYDIIGGDGETSNTVILGRVKRLHIVSVISHHSGSVAYQWRTERVCLGPSGSNEGIDREITARVEVGRDHVSPCLQHCIDACQAEMTRSYGRTTQ